MRSTIFAALGLAVAACAAPAGEPPPPPAAEEPAPPGPELPDFDGTDELLDCRVGLRCTGAVAREPGRWRFHFACPRTSIWEVSVEGEAPLELSVAGAGGRSYAPPGFTSLEEDGRCVATVVLEEAGAFALSVRRLEPALDEAGCDELCLADRPGGEARGCDCARTCHDACRDFGIDCGLPCNSDVEGYACPFLEEEIARDEDCRPYPSDDGKFEHVGSCYRCGDGNQCCYTGGRDNGTGSFDLCPPLDPGPDEPDPNGCGGVFDHCACDVVPLCGCMAEVGDLELCEACVGPGNFDLLSCNAPGDDGTFCRRALEAAEAGFGWCARLGDPVRCFERPAGF